MIIDCHGHYTTVPLRFRKWREAQVAAADDPASAPPLADARLTDDEFR